MGEGTGRFTQVGAAALSDALRYLHELEWETLYRRQSRAGLGENAGQPLEAQQAFAGASGGTEDSNAIAAAIAPSRTTLDRSPQRDLRSAEERAAALALVAAEASRCERCALARGRTHVVFASGDPDADLMIIGEGPGAQEDRQGLPFVGPAGELLTRILLAIERTRDQVYIANIVKCRPPQNRDPLPEEVAACRPYLDQQIALVQPRVIVALGRVAAQTLLGNDYPVGRLRGTWWEVAGVPVRVTYHPAALLRDANLKRPTWEDMKIVRERLRESAPGRITSGAAGSSEQPPPSA
jgi:DNA polymerase